MFDICVGIRLKVRTMGKYLARWGHTLQKPMKKAHEPSPMAVKQWLGTDYSIIAQRVEFEGADIHWGDESGLSSDDVGGHSSAPDGKTPTVVANHKRRNLSVISAVTNKGQMRGQFVDGAANADIFIGLLNRLIKGAPKKIFLIVDTLRVHYSKPVKT